MANLDKPRGFQPAKMEDGGGWCGVIRSVGVNDAADIFMFDHLTTSSGLAASATADGDTILGVAVGFGKNNTVAGSMGNSVEGMPFDPENLMSGARYYDDSANTHTEWNVFYVPARGVLFSAQSNGDESAALLVGTSYDLVYGSGDTTTGISAYEIDGNQTAAAGEGVTVLGFGTDPENDRAQDFSNYLVKFVDVV